MYRFIDLALGKRFTTLYSIHESLVFINRALSFNKNQKVLFNEKEKKIYQKRELRGGKIKVRTQGYIVAWYANADYRKKRSRFQFN